MNINTLQAVNRRRQQWPKISPGGPMGGPHGAGHPQKTAAHRQTRTTHDEAGALRNRMAETIIGS